MNQSVERPEYRMFGTKSSGEPDEFIDREAIRVRGAKDTVHAHPLQNLLSPKDGLDSLVDRFRLHQEA